jgi:hypothetical protein
MGLGRGPEGLKQLVGLHTKKCIPCEGGKAEALDKVAANKLRNQVCLPTLGGLILFFFCIPLAGGNQDGCD